MTASHSKFEYKVLKLVDTDAEQKMNHLGAQGWRVVAHQPFSGSMFRTVFEREIAGSNASGEEVVE